MPRMTTLADIEAQLPYVDDPDVLTKTASNPILLLALEMSRPKNWWGTGLKPEHVLPVAEEGIPVVWIPNPVILKLLVNTESSERVALLISRQEEVIDQCRHLLDECRYIALRDSRFLLERALDAYAGEYHEAAMALTVVVAEGLALWASRLRMGVLASIAGGGIDAIIKRAEKMGAHLSEGYRLAAKELSSGILDDSLVVSRRALIAPIRRFFTPFYPDKDDLAPMSLSRHVVVHQPKVEHFSKGNALLAIMLATSLLRERETFYEANLDPEPEDL